MKYVIHIGLPKTGTKYIQNSLSHLRSRLLTAGINYPNDMWTKSSHFSHFEIVEKIRRGAISGLKEYFDKFNSSSCDTIVLSCEGFVDLKVEQIEQLNSLLDGAQAEIVLYTRRWTDWIPSAWQQSVRQGDRDTLPEFINKLLRNPENEQAVNHGLILDRFERVFGKESIKIISYSNVMDAKKDLLDDFGEIILNIPSLGPEAKRPIVNESISVKETNLVRTLNGLDYGADRSSFLIDRAFKTISEGVEVKADMDLIFAAMEKNKRTVVLSDNARALQFVYDYMFQKYKDNIVGVGAGQKFFEKKTREIPYISADFLLAEGVADAIRRIHKATASFFGINDKAKMLAS
jgi:hypothetical protein